MNPKGNDTGTDGDTYRAGTGLPQPHRARQPKAKSGYIAAEIFCSNVGCEHGSSTEHDTFGKKVIDEKKQGGYNTNQQQILQEAAYEH